MKYVYLVEITEKVLTYLSVEAITTENAVVLLDEISRAHPDAANILMTVLDLNQRYLRIDEMDGTPVIKVAKGVSFLAMRSINSSHLFSPSPEIT